jgi:hypothetical protein
VTAVARLPGLLLALLVVAGGSGAANGGGGAPGVGSIVHDPTSYLQHVRSVQSALVAEAQRAQQIQQQWQSLLTQTQQYDTMVRQLAGLRPEDLLGARALSMQNAQRAADYLGRLDRLGDSLQSLHAEAQLTQRAQALSRLTWPEYVERERLLAGSRAERQREVFADAQRAMRRVEADYAQVQAIQARIPRTEGAHQSLQMLNEQMSLLIAQNAGLQAQIAQRDARSARDAAQTELLAARAARERDLEVQAAEQRAGQARAVAARARAQAAEAIEARRLAR